MGDGGAEGGDVAAAGGQHAHHQTAPRGKVDVHLGRTQEVLPW